MPRTFIASRILRVAPDAFASRAPSRGLRRVAHAADRVTCRRPGTSAPPRGAGQEGRRPGGPCPTSTSSTPPRPLHAPVPPRPLPPRAAATELERAAAAGRAVTLALVDIDGFRALNQRRGVDAADAALAAIALRLRRLTRATDVLGRTGADELAVLMPGTSLAGARACCERLIAELEAGDLPRRAS